LKEAIEQVSSFGKAEATSKESAPLAVELEPASIPTVTKTGNEEKHEVENVVKVLERYGAGEWD
jgi:hypothetical protein